MVKNVNPLLEEVEKSCHDLHEHYARRIILEEFMLDHCDARDMFINWAAEKENKGKGIDERIPADEFKAIVYDYAADWAGM